MGKFNSGCRNIRELSHHLKAAFLNMRIGTGKKSEPGAVSRTSAIHMRRYYPPARNKGD